MLWGTTVELQNGYVHLTKSGTRVLELDLGHYEVKPKPGLPEQPPPSGKVLIELTPDEARELAKELVEYANRSKRRD